MRGTVVANVNHGCFLSCRNQQAKQEAMQCLKQIVTADWILDHAESVAFDKGQEFRYDGEVSLENIIESWTEARTLTKRGIYVRVLS